MSNEVDYLLSILGKEGYTSMDHWIPSDPADKNNPGKFPGWWDISCVRVYEMEDVKKRTDETIGALVDLIHQLAWCALIADGSDAAVEFEVQCGMICVIPDSDIELWKELLKVSQDKGVSHLHKICHTYYAIESGTAAMCAGKTINAVQKSHLP